MITASSRVPCSSDTAALVHRGATSCIRSAPVTSVRSTPASWARPMTRFHAWSIRSRDRDFRSGLFSNASCSSVRNVRLVLA